LIQIDFKLASGMINFYAGNCLTRLPRKARAGRVDYGSLWKNHKRFDL